MKKIAMFSCVMLTLCFATLAQSQEAKKYKLQGRYPEGRYEMQQAIKMDMIMNMGGRAGGQDMPITTEQNQYQEITAGPIAADGTQKVVMESKRIVMRQKNGFMDMEFDSDKPEEAEKSPLKMLGSMVGLKVTMTYDKDGKVTKVEGLDEFFDKIFAEAPAMTRPMLETMKEQMSGDSMAKMADFAQNVMPKNSVAVGESWTAEQDLPIPMLGEMKGQSENTLKSVEMVDGVEIAEIVSVLTLKADKATPVEFGPVKTTFEKSDLKMTTTTKMEVASGLVFSGIADTEMDMALTMGAPTDTEKESADDTQPPMTMKMSGKGTTTVTVKRINTQSEPQP